MARGSSQSKYDDPEEYDHITQRRQFDRYFYLRQAGLAAGPALEIGVGTGRVGIHLAEFGIPITGIDRSKKMLSRARAKAKMAGVKIRLIEGDSLTLSLKERFGLIYIPYNPHIEYQTLREWEALLGRIRAHLRPGGRLAFDIENPVSAHANRFISLSEESRKEFRFVHLYPEETRFILGRGGFKVESFFGNFSYKPFSIKDPFQVVVARPCSP